MRCLQLVQCIAALMLVHANATRPRTKDKKDYNTRQQPKERPQKEPAHHCTAYQVIYKTVHHNIEERANES